MKSSLSILILFLFFIITAYTQQCLPGNNYFGTQADIDNFIINNPDCTEILGSLEFSDAGISNLNAFSQINTIHGDLTFYNNGGLLTLQGLEGLTTIHGDLTLLENFSLINLSGLENLTTINGNFSLSQHGESLESIQELSGLTSVGGDVRLVGLYINSLEGLENLSHIGSDLVLSVMWNLQDLHGLENVNFIGGQLFVNDNPSLTSLEELGNFDPFELQALQIKLNPQLSFCLHPSICQYLANYPATIFGNNDDCNDEIEILSNCGDYSKLAFLVFYDTDGNKLLDAGEPFIDGIKLKIQPGDITVFSNSLNGGKVYLDSGNYIINYLEDDNPLWALTTDSLSYDLMLDNIIDCDTVLYGLLPTANISSAISTVNSPPARCQSWIVFEVAVHNTGFIIIEEGILWLEVDEEILETNFIDPPDTIVGSNIYGWIYSGLFPGQFESRKIRLKIPGPPDFPIGEYLLFSSYTTFTDANGAHEKHPGVHIVHWYNVHSIQMIN